MAERARLQREMVAFAQIAVLSSCLSLACCLFAMPAAAYGLGFGEYVDFLFFISCIFVGVFIFFYVVLKVARLFWKSHNHASKPKGAMYPDGSLSRGRNPGSRTRQIRM